MIDIHTHCLPEIDDGAKSIEESVNMLRYSFSQGVTACVATPHCVIHDHTDIKTFIDKRNKQYFELQRAIEKEALQYPQIKLGAEVYLDNDISQYEDIQRVCIADSSYMLIEMPGHIGSDMLSEWIYNLFLKGINPIIAHIDRYENYIDIVYDAGNENTLFQINASRFLSFRGRKLINKLYKYSHRLIVSSDMHNTTSRKCNMQQAYRIAAQKYGVSAANDMFSKTAKELLKS